MATTKEDIRRWLQRCNKDGCSHMAVMCDTFDWSNYPVGTYSEKEARELYDKPGEMQKVIEVYDLSLDWDEQLSKHRVFNF